MFSYATKIVFCLLMAYRCCMFALGHHALHCHLSSKPNLLTAADASDTATHSSSKGNQSSFSTCHSDTACIGAEFRRSRVGCLDPADTVTTVPNCSRPISVKSIHAEPNGHSLVYSLARTSRLSNIDRRQPVCGLAVFTGAWALKRI